MRWKLSKGSFRQKELPISDKKSMSYETNQKSNVFTITQLTPSELTTTISNSGTSYQKYKPRSSGDSNFDYQITTPAIIESISELAPITTTTATTNTIIKNNNISTSQSTSHQQHNNNHSNYHNHHQSQQQKQQHHEQQQQQQHHQIIKRRSSFEEALKFCHTDIDKYRDNNETNNGEVFIISSSNNQTIDKNKHNQQSMPWTSNHNQQYHRKYPHEQYSTTSSLDHSHHNHHNLSSSSSSSIVPVAAIAAAVSGSTNHQHHHQHQHHHLHHHQNNGISNHHCISNNNDTSSNSNPNTTTTTLTTVLDNGYIDESNSNSNFHYINSMTTTHPSSNGSINNTKLGSTTKLLPNSTDDQSSTQTQPSYLYFQSKCSYFGGLLLCLCLNITYTNIIRFPRELDQYGTAYLIPYFIILFLVGLPIILLEVSIGQFLGQGAANSWRASPIFKGASVVSRFSSWLAALWISMQATLAVVYIGMLIFKSVPFSDCASGVKIIAQAGYKENIKGGGQECIQKTFLAPIWMNAQFFGFLTLGLVLLWLIMLGCTFHAKVFRRINFIIGTIGFGLLISLAGWEVYKSLGIQYFPELWSFNVTFLIDSNIWFSALVQVIYSTNIGFGIIPVVTGKFLHKGDAMRTTILYFCFNLLINAISVILFMVQFDNIVTRNSDNPLKELKPLTAVYDKVINDNDLITTRVIPGIIYSLFVISALVSISMSIYTSAQLVPRHPSYVLNLLGLIVGVTALLGPKYIVARVLDSRIAGTLVIVALVFDLIATTWIYGAKNIRTDLEFSIGRTIYITWLMLWCFSPVILTGILVWWCVDVEQYDLLYNFIPRWAPIIFAIAIILVIACIEIFKQVDYNFFGMICEAAKPAKEWGPADPLARHAWKQWRSVCQDTGRKDFTLRRRGTRDYTHSIKRGQYSTSATTKYGTQNWKSSTPGNSSPNYSGSMFGDSAIEEDMSVDKYSGVDSQQFTTAFSSDNNSVIIKPPIRYSNRSRKISHERINQRHNSAATADRHKEIVYIRRMSTSNERNNTTNSTKIEITPANDSVYSTRNPIASASASSTSISALATVQSNNNNNGNRLSNSSQRTTSNNHPIENGDHICWRKFSVNSEEYSTEL